MACEEENTADGEFFFLKLRLEVMFFNLNRISLISVYTSAVGKEEGKKKKKKQNKNPTPKTTGTLFNFLLAR